MTTHRRQRGFYLLSLMIGLVISMIVLLAALTAFKVILRSGLSSREDSASDSGRLASVLAAQIDLQGAGYGITSPSFGTDLVLISGASFDSSSKQLSGTTVSTGSSGNAIVWGNNTGSGYQCEGIYAPASGGLWLLTTQTCASATAGWSSLAWSYTVLDGSSRTLTSIAATVPSSGCVPFGLAGEGGILVTFTSTTTRLFYSVSDNSTSTAAQQSYTSSSCLANFPAS